VAPEAVSEVFRSCDDNRMIKYILCRRLPEHLSRVMAKQENLVLEPFF
jgi:hypothetical protein